MTTLFIILIIIASAVLSFIVLVQNPKGGGLAGNVAGLSNQFMGVKQTTDILEKGTWLFATIIGVLCLLSVMFINGGKKNVKNPTIDAAAPAATGTQNSPLQPQPPAPVNNTPAPVK